MKVLELFAGIGACSTALRNIGIECEIVDAVEIDKYAIKSFNAIHGTDFEPQDITEWDKPLYCPHCHKLLAHASDSRAFGITEPAPICVHCGTPTVSAVGMVDIITHGSPCQDFSVAGLQKGGDEGSGTRSSLMYETLRIVEKLKPKYVLWENVKAVLSAKHKHNFDKYQERMAEMGYYNHYAVLNAKDYGVPQNRERVFTVSIRKDIVDENEVDGFGFPSPTNSSGEIKKVFDLPKGIIKDNERQRRVYSAEGISPTILNRTDSPKIVEFKFPEPQTLTIRLADILENEVDEKYYLNDEQVSKFKITSSKSSDGIIKVGDLGIKANQQVRRVYSSNGISPTLDTMTGGHRQPKIIASRGRGEHNEQHIEPRKDGLTNTLTSVQKDNMVCESTLRIRKLTPRECWRLMGFSDEDFDKAAAINSNTQLYKQAGNSIVVNVIEAIFRNML